LPNSGPATPSDQLLVGKLLPADPTHPAELTYQGLATLGSIDFPITSPGTYTVISPTSPEVLVSGRFITTSGAPIAGALVASSADPTFRAITDASGGYTLPAGPPGAKSMVVGQAFDALGGLGGIGIRLPPDFPGSGGYLKDMIRGRLGLTDADPEPPCADPKPTVVLVSKDQPDLPGQQREPFRLTTGGPPIETRLTGANGLLGGDIFSFDNAGGIDILDTFVNGFGPLSLFDSTTAIFKTKDDPVALVALNGDNLHAVAAGTTSETGIAVFVRIEKITVLGVEVPYPCVDIASDTRPVEVAPPLTIDQKGPLDDGEVGAPYRAALTAQGGWPYPLPTKPPSYLWSATALPDGLSMSTDGFITGRPDVAGTFNITVEVTDSNTPATKTGATLAIEIRPVVTITTTLLLDGLLNQPYNSSVAATGGIKPYSWSSTSLPPGVSYVVDPVTQALTLHGSPTYVGIFNIRFRVTDALSVFRDKTLTITITSASLVCVNYGITERTVGAVGIIDPSYPQGGWILFRTYHWKCMIGSEAIDLVGSWTQAWCNPTRCVWDATGAGGPRTSADAFGTSNETFETTFSPLSTPCRDTAYENSLGCSVKWYAFVTVRATCTIRGQVFSFLYPTRV